MKPKPSPSKQRAKRPKARTMWGVSHLGIVRSVHREIKPAHVFSWESVSHVAVVPCSSRQQVRQLVRWHNKTYAQKFSAIFGLIISGSHSSAARAILNLLGESPDPEN